MLPYCEKHQAHWSRTGSFRERYACLKCREERGSEQRGIDQLKREGNKR